MKNFREFLSENLETHIDDFVGYACSHLEIPNAPKIIIVNDKASAAENRSFGSYFPGNHEIKVNVAGRHPVDVFRTLAHELVHHRQNLDGKLNDVAEAGETGSDCENEANAKAGVIMRNYGKTNPYIFESVNGEETLHAFDIDGTLMHSTARVHVRRTSDGQRIESLSHSEFNNHELHPGQHYDFSEFRSAKQFDKEKPIRPMLAKLKAIQNNIQNTGRGRVILNTARSDFDDKHHFAKAWNKFGVDINKVHVERAGNIHTDETVPEKKNRVFMKHLDSGRYKEVHFYDDDKNNLKAFLKLKKKYPSINFHAHHAQPDGSTKTYKGE